MVFTRKRRFDASSTNEEIKRRRQLSKTETYRWWCKARKQEHPGLPPLCSRWLHNRFEVFLRDLGRDPYEALTQNFRFEAAPGAEELSRLTLRISGSTPVVRRHTTRASLGIEQAKEALTHFDFTIPTPARVSLKGHFGRQRPQDTLRPVQRQGLLGEVTSLQPAPLSNRNYRARYGQQAITLEQWRCDILPRLLNFIDSLGTYLAPAARKRHGLPVHQGWVPFSSKTNGYTLPEHYNLAQRHAWRAFITKIFLAPTHGPQACFGGTVDAEDLDKVFTPTQAEKRRPYLQDTKTSKRRVYKLGRFKDDLLWTLTTPKDVGEQRIYLTLLGDLEDLTTAMRWKVIERFSSAPATLSTDPEEIQLKQHQLPPTMRYKDQLDFFRSPDGPVYNPIELNDETGESHLGNAANFATFPATFGFPDTNDPEVRALNTKRAERYRTWRKTQTKGKRVWPPSLADADKLGLVERTPSGAVRWVYLPMKERNGVGNPDAGFRPRGWDWSLRPSLQIDPNAFLHDEVYVALALVKAWQMFLSRRTHRCVEFIRDPLGEDYFHPVTLQTYLVLVNNLCSQRNPYDPKTGLRTYSTRKQRAYLETKAARQNNTTPKQPTPPPPLPPYWNLPYHPESHFAHTLAWVVAARRMHEEDVMDNYRQHCADPLAFRREIDQKKLEARREQAQFEARLKDQR